MNLFRLSLGLMLSLGFSANDVSAISFQGLGLFNGFETRADDISADGKFIAGSSIDGNPAITKEAFRWSFETHTFEGLGILPGRVSSRAEGISPNGNVVVGRSRDDLDNSEAFAWIEGTGMLSLGFLPGGSSSWAFETTIVEGTVEDTIFVVGESTTDIGDVHATLWKIVESTIVEIKDLGTLGGEFSDARDITDDGEIIAGSSNKVGENAQFVLWDKASNFMNAVELGFLQGAVNPFNLARAISANGNVVVGSGLNDSSNSEATLWSQETGMIPLGTLDALRDMSTAWAVSGNGNIVVGQLFDGTTEAETRAFIWDDLNEMRDYQVLLENDFGLGPGSALDGWKLTVAKAISNNGSVVSGWGLNPDGKFEAWVTVVPEPSTLLLLGIGLIGFAGYCRRGTA